MLQELASLVQLDGDGVLQSDRSKLGRSVCCRRLRMFLLVLSLKLL